MFAVGAAFGRPPSAYKASIPGGWGHPPLRNVTNLVRRGRCPQRPVTVKTGIVRADEDIRPYCAPRNDGAKNLAPPMGELARR